MSEEPEAKKMKPTGWEDHTLNISGALMKDEEGKLFSDISKENIQYIKGIGPKHDVVLEALNVKTVEDLANYKYFLLARAIVTLSEVEKIDGRPSESKMNIDRAVDKEWEAKSLSEIVEAPISAIEGLSEKASTLFNDLGVKTIKDLAKFKYCRLAEAIVEASKYEHTKDATERKIENATKMLK
mmetsp:Transcript_34899/g.39788  ORF Transcript_34899/g.39788 Transcript_34899/m.39788 type:complete len:184 (-) Transcript_34899:109-660(-)|eukprot:CAMPEP_0194147594 /NCGR_PEP_ID=MMETSP0152-20130528/26263_1 /TAXON_ID=1049557 /ORGANISM="Thalassiothrix antarctica, Strain L6-D1" /LENGTH=183 /DNA_ID=CAMNT_0038848527 /DNA_START=131 /DNA_END=682 /DNA_ORIENTATION=+